MTSRGFSDYVKTFRSVYEAQPMNRFFTILESDSTPNARAFVLNEDMRLGHVASILSSLGFASSCEEKRSHSSSVTQGRG